MSGFGIKTGPINEFITRKQFICKCVAFGCGTCDYESCMRQREGQINEKEQCGEGQLANANNLIEIVLQASFCLEQKQLNYTNKLYDELKQQPFVE